MLKIPDKYLWDGKENLSDDFLIRRMIEYASFLELIRLPTSDVYHFLKKYGTKRLRCDETRKIYLERLMPYLLDNKDWKEATLQMIKENLSKVLI